MVWILPARRRHYALSMENPSHIPVLLDQVLAGLSPQSGEVYVDGTAGLGGHACAIAGRIAPDGRVILCDLDAGNLAKAADRVRQTAPTVAIETMHINFAAMPRQLKTSGHQADMVLADLGFASNQMDDGDRGFSFMRDGPLDMRLDPSSPTTAADLIATLPEAELTRLIRDYGEERAARAIACRIVAQRAENPIETTAQLADLVRSVVRKTGKIDPATKTFQAFRIAVNDELGSLEALLAQITRAAQTLARQDEAATWLNNGARIGIISFHSLEDRLVKRAFGRLINADLAESIGRSVQVADDAEQASNPRSRSAKLRLIRIVADKAGNRPTYPV